MWTFVFLLLILDSVKVYCLHVQMPRSLCVLQDSLLRRKAHLKAHLPSKATKQKPLTFYLCFHLKTKTKNLHHTELRFAEKYVSNLRKISVWQMVYMPLSRGPFRSRGQKGDPIGCRWETAWTHGKWKQDLAAELGLDIALLPTAWEWEGHVDSWELQGQANQDLGTTQEVSNPLA